MLYNDVIFKIQTIYFKSVFGQSNKIFNVPNIDI